MIRDAGPSAVNVGGISNHWQSPGLANAWSRRNSFPRGEVLGKRGAVALATGLVPDRVRILHDRLVRLEQGLLEPGVIDLQTRMLQDAFVQSALLSS